MKIVSKPKPVAKRANRREATSENPRAAGRPTEKSGVRRTYYISADTEKRLAKLAQLLGSKSAAIDVAVEEAAVARGITIEGED